MGYQVLARKWRPGKFSELVGQEHVVRAISNALDNNRLHHAYLFTGTRGVGKTTIARIFSRSLNCETGMSSNPCGVCAACLDIEKGSYVDLIEIDAASRTKVEDTREILDNVQYRPTRGEYKVYLIDEVHMLSRHSFNALLKTLEEPPPHIKFLLATTDPQKLPITILSRCLQFNLKALTREQIGGQLSHILKAENIAFENKAIELLARSAHGSMRDALSLTDQAIAQGNGQVMPDVVSEMLGLIDADQISRLVKAILEKNKIQVLEISSDLALMGTDFKAALAELMSVFHQIALTQFVPEACKLETAQARQIYAWARAVNPETVQLYYQIALQGRKDIEWAQDLKVGFEMALMRMMAFTPEAITTDISDLHTSGKQANEAHSQQFSSPPESLLADPVSGREQAETDQAEALQKKNESESKPLAEPIVDNQLVEPIVDNQLAEPIADHQPENDAHSEISVQAQVAAPLSEAETGDAANQSLSNEMLSLIQEADELRPEPQAVTNQRETSENTATDIATLADEPTVASLQKQETALQEFPDAAPHVALSETTHVEVSQGAKIQAAPETDNQLQAPDNPLQVPEKQAQNLAAQYDEALFEPSADEYADYDMLQQNNGMPSLDDYHEAETKASIHAQQATVAKNVPSSSPVQNETGSSANTASLLTLMQTLNQTAAEENKSTNNKSPDTGTSAAGNHEQVEEQATYTEVATSAEEQTFDEEQPTSEEQARFGPQKEEEQTAAENPVQSGSLTAAPLQSSAFNYSDDLYQTDAGTSNPVSVSDGPEQAEPQGSEPEPQGEDAFFSAQSFLHQQDVEAKSVPTAANNVEQSDLARDTVLPETNSFQAPVPEPENAQKDSFSSTNNRPPEDNFPLHEQGFPDEQEGQAVYSPDDDLNAYSQMSEAQPAVAEHQATVQQVPEEEYLATDTTMSVDFEIPFAVDGKKVTKASQLDTWSQLIERAGLGGLTKQLALNSNYFKNGEHIKLVVSETQTHLLSENTIRTIEESISDAIQQPIKVDANIGEVIDTPAAVQKAINTMRQEHAVNTINQDNAVADICQSFSGTILQDTIKPR